MKHHVAGNDRDQRSLDRKVADDLTSSFHIRSWLLRGALVAFLLAMPVISSAIVNGTLSTTAIIVLGQPDFFHATANAPDASSLNAPVTIAIDPSGGAGATRVYIADFNNNRVLGWDSITALVNGASANIVLGQPDFLSSSCNQFLTPSSKTLCNPTGVAVDAVGNVYVADFSNNRVLEFGKPAANAIDPAANLVIGQAANFAANRCNFGGAAANAESLCLPRGVSTDASNNVYVTDTGNHRVVEYNTPLTINGAVPGSGDTVADEVFGQPDFASRLCNQTAGLTAANTLCNPYGHVAIDSLGNVYIADHDNSRVLEYNKPVNAIDPPANVAFGQTSLTSNLCNGSVNGAANLCSPQSVAVDASNNLYIADTGNNRALEYGAPLTTDSTADMVYGQGADFGSTSCNVTGTQASSQTLCIPTDVAINTGTGQLWISDQNNNRAVAISSPLTTTTATLELGQDDFVQNPPNIVDNAAMNLPTGVAIDKSITPNRVYVVDSNNNRVLGYPSETALTSGAAATIVIGQPDLHSSLCDYNGVTAQSLCFPNGAVVDAHGNLYVVDTSNSRVLEYSAPFASGFVGAQPASMVWGQAGDFSSNACNFFTFADADTLCSPKAAALDSSGNLYVADTGNNRALEYNNPLNNIAANFVFGQSGSFTTGVCNQGAAAAASTLCAPDGIAVDSQGNVYIADELNHRILEYNNPFAPGGSSTANRVFGQTNFTNSTCNAPGLGAASLCSPGQLAIDGSGNLFATDISNSRTLEYNTPLVSGTTASRVFGQGDNLTSNFCNLAAPTPSSQTLCSPQGVATDSTGNIFVADTNNSRVLQYDPPQLAPRRWSFGIVNAGSKVSKTFVFRSDSLSVTISGIGLSGPSAGNMTQTNTCPAQLAPKKSCAITVTYTASVTGPATATLAVTDNAYNSPSSAQIH